jgi:hypothetical protein
MGHGTCTAQSSWRAGPYLNEARERVTAMLARTTRHRANPFRGQSQASRSCAGPRCSSKRAYQDNSSRHQGYCEHPPVDTRYNRQERSQRCSKGCRDQGQLLDDVDVIANRREPREEPLTMAILLLVGVVLIVGALGAGLTRCSAMCNASGLRPRSRRIPAARNRLTSVRGCSGAERRVHSLCRRHLLGDRQRLRTSPETL